MEIKSTFWALRGDTPDQAKSSLKKYTKVDLMALVFNERINNFVSEWADYGELDSSEDKHGHGKRVPYVGWYWRSTDFYNLHIPIGNCHSFIGIMENNKWDYPQRYLTEEEAKKVLAIIWEAKLLSEKGGNLKEIHDNTKAKLGELWDLFQTFKI